MALKGDLEAIKDLSQVALTRIRSLNLAKSYLEGDESMPIDITPENKQAWREERDAAVATIKTLAAGLP